ncbi:MAG: carbohydrate-binding protein, partial [Sphingobacteriales bacterium]
MKNNKGFKIPLAIPYLSVMLLAFSCAKEDMSASNALNENYNPELSLSSTTVTASALSSPIKIEAESYTSMSGVVLRDAEGGKGVGYIEANDWMNYSVSVPTAGSYKLNFRVAGPGGKFQVKNAAGTVLATVTVPNTGGYYTYTTVSVDAPLVAGQQTIRLFALTSGYNINWFEVSGGPAVVAPTDPVVTPTTPTAPTSGTTAGTSPNLLYRETFEGSSVWPGGLGTEWNTSYGFTTVSNLFHQGSKAGRFELRDGDADEYPR